MIERAKIDIQSYRTENKGEDVTITQLKNVLSTYFTEVPEENNLQEKLKEEDFKLKSKTEYGGHEIEISDIYTGSLAEKTEGTQVTAEEVNAKIGQTVDYEDNSNGKVESWRVFYASDTELFLISSNTMSSSDAFGSDRGIPTSSKNGIEYTGAENVFATDYGTIYNSRWKATNTANTDGRSQATAYLCDPVNWKEYIGTNAPKGTYAIGGPTVELLVKSWVASKQTEETLETILEDTTVSADGYAQLKPGILYGSVDSGPMQSTILDGLYSNGTRSYWLASPCSQNSNSVCLVLYNGNLAANVYFDSSNGVRPLVSIPMTEVEINNGIITIGNN